MPLTTAQKATLKAAILADSTLNAFPNTTDGNFDLAAKLSTELTSPAFIVWRKRVPIMEIGKNMISTDVANLTTANLSRLQVLAAFAAGFVDASADVENGYNDIFSVAGASGTRNNLHIIWRRTAKLIEKIFATGTGSDASPAVMGFEGTVTGADVESARNS